MKDEKTNTWQFRDFQTTDIPALVEIINLEYPDEPTTVEQEEHWERSYPSANPRLRYAVVDPRRTFTGIGVCEKPFWAIAPGVYTVFALVHPDWRKRGIGHALLAQFEQYAAKQGAERLWTDCRESQADSISFLRATGFQQFGIRFEQALDLQQFNLDAFPGAIKRIEDAGYAVTTLAAFREVRSDADRALYEVFRETVLDVPLPGGARISMEYEQWRKGLDSPTADPAYTFLALMGHEVVGETSLELLKDGPAITSATGVRREHRGRGIAFALKLASLQALKELGYKEARTHNDTENPAILNLNEKLGYHRLPGWLQWEKSVSKRQG